jgi:hypothetical protein
MKSEVLELKGPLKLIHFVKKCGGSLRLALARDPLTLNLLSLYDTVLKVYSADGSY